MRLPTDRTAIEQQSNMNREELNNNREKQIAAHFFHPKLEFFVLDLKVHHSNSIILTFCHGLATLRTQNLTILISYLEFIQHDS